MTDLAGTIHSCASTRRRNLATASAFADWVYEKTVRQGQPVETEYLESASRQLRLQLGSATHRDIELFFAHTWTQNFLGVRARLKWELYFADTKERPDHIFTSSRLSVGGKPLRCIPDVVLTCPSQDSVLIIERKTTFVPENKLPPTGWPNVEAQLWCYSWIDEFRDATEVLLVGQLWYRERGGISLCHRHPAWKRSTNPHERQCSSWFSEYGGEIAQ